MNPTKKAATDTTIHSLLADRWSPYAFSERMVPAEDLFALLEAARWAPSSYNEQPWRYIVARRTESAEFERMLSCLVEGNQAWARHAPVLMIGVAVLEFSRNGKPNKAAHHDLGLASATLTMEATARGLAVHQMIGIVPERVRELYDVPASAEPLTALAVGYAGSGEGLPDALQERDRTERSRRPQAEFVFEGAWSRPAEFGRS